MRVSKTLIVITILIFNSCKSTYNLNYNIFQLKSTENGYTLSSTNSISKSADKQIWYPNWFEINLPHGIKKFKHLSRFYIFNYSKNQFIIIDKSYIDKNEDNKSDFEYYEIKTLNKFERHYEIYEKSYLSEHIKKIKFKKDRISMIYTDGNTRILFYNIIPSSKSKFETIISSFKYTRIFKR